VRQVASDTTSPSVLRDRSVERSVLYVVHAMPPEEDTGTPLLAAGYAAEMARRGWDVTVVYSSDAVGSWSEIAPHRLAGEDFTRYAVPIPAPFMRGGMWPVGAASDETDPTSPATVFFETLLTTLAPDLVHIVDNVSLPLDWPDRAAARGVSVIRTVSCAEDLCGSIPPVSPLSESVGYCLPPLSPERCARCLFSMGLFTHLKSEGLDKDVPPPLVAMLEEKRARMTTQFGETFDRIIFSSRAFRAYFESSAPLDPSKVVVVPLGIDPIDGQVQAVTPKGERRTLTFGYFGTVATAKGLDAVATAFLHPSLLDRDDYELQIYGGGDESIIAELLDKNPRVHWFGPYEPAQLPALLSCIDIGLSPSRFETFHRVTREYLLSGVPVIGSTAFGIPEVVRHGHNGLIFEHAQPDSLLHAVTACLDQPELVERLTAGALTTDIRSVRDEVDDLVSLYAEVL